MPRDPAWMTIPATAFCGNPARPGGRYYGEQPSLDRGGIDAHLEGEGAETRGLNGQSVVGELGHRQSGSFYLEKYPVDGASHPPQAAATSLTA
jgi:hypothetical protein